MEHKFSQFDKSMKIVTVIRYMNIYNRYKDCVSKGEGKMQCYTNVSEDLNIPERTVIRAVKTVATALANNKK